MGVKDLASALPLTIWIVPESTFSPCSHCTKPWSTVRAAVEEKSGGQSRGTSWQKLPGTCLECSPAVAHSPGGSGARVQVPVSLCTRSRACCTRAWHSRSFSARTSRSL